MVSFNFENSTHMFLLFHSNSTIVFANIIVDFNFLSQTNFYFIKLLHVCIPLFFFAYLNDRLMSP